MVLAYILNESRRFETFVANRVEEIRSKTDVDSWYYIHTSANPADYASRGLETNQLHKHKSWLQGPNAHSQEDKLFLDILNKGICYKESRYEMPLPFKQDRPPLLPNNQGVESHSFNIFIKSYAMKFVVFCRLNPISTRCNA